MRQDPLVCALSAHANFQFTRTTRLKSQRVLQKSAPFLAKKANYLKVPKWSCRNMGSAGIAEEVAISQGIVLIGLLKDLMTTILINRMLLRWFQGLHL